MLQSIDDETYYEINYNEVKALIQDDLDAFVAYGSKATKKLCSFLIMVSGLKSTFEE
jgi:hypothetical protein